MCREEKINENDDKEFRDEDKKQKLIILRLVNCEIVKHD